MSSTTVSDIRRLIPKMDKVLSWPAVAALASATSRTELREAVRAVLDQLRSQINVENHPDLTPSELPSWLLNRCSVPKDLRYGG